MLTYVAFQGFIDERMERIIHCLEKHGWQVEVLLIHPERGWLVLPGGKHLRVRQRWVSSELVNQLLLIPFTLFITGLGELAKRKLRTSLLYVNNFPDSEALPFLVLGKIFRIPTVYDLRDPWKEFISTEAPESSRNRLRFRIYLELASIIELAALTLASALIFTTSGLQELHSSQARTKHSLLVQSYSDYSEDREISSRVQAIKDTLKLRKGIVASYIGGGFQPYRGVDVLLESVKIISRQDPPLKILIVGGHGETLGWLRSRIKEFGIENYCVTTGWVPSSQLIYYFAASDVGIVPYRRTVATELCVPIKLFNYLALGKPLIVSSVREISKIIEDGVNGLKVKPDDPESLAGALLKFANSSKLAASLKSSAMEDRGKYSFAKMEAPLMEFITKVAK